MEKNFYHRIMRSYLKYLAGISLISIANHFVANALNNNEDSEVSDYGFGKAYKWKKLHDGFDEAKVNGKPVFLLIHKSTCPACQKLKDKFSLSMKLIDLSNYFVMINVENSSDVLSNDKIYTPDGKYVPRILFFTSNGEFIRNAYNRHPDADPEHRYFYSSPGQIVEVMQQILDNNGRNTLPESPNMTKK